MKAAIIKIGNSQGLRIPKPIIKQCGFKQEVELEVHDKELIIKPASHPRQNWEKAFKTMAQNGDDKLIESPETKWGEEECADHGVRLAKLQNLVFHYGAKTSTTLSWRVLSCDPTW